MTTLEKVTQLKNQGMSDDQIINDLQQQGVPPKEINDALNQSQIKKAVYSEENIGDQPIPSQYNQQNLPASQITMQAPIDQSQAIPELPSEPPAQQEYYSQEPYPTTSYDQYQDPNYSQTYSGAVATDTDSMIEIAQQVFSEKIKKIQNQMEELTEFKTLGQVKIGHIDLRLKKVEETIDKLQLTILEKVGSYGENLETIKKEMTMIENSFSKILPSRENRQTSTLKKSSSKKRKSSHQKK